MQEDQQGPSAVFARGGRASIIRSFQIEGLHGYRDIGLSSRYAATILIAKNGTGKTTLLGALDAFLRMQFGRLRELEFKSIRCELEGEPDALIITHDDVVDFLQVPSDVEFQRLAARAGVDPRLLFGYLVEEYHLSNREDRFSSESKVLAGLKQAFNYNYNDIDVALSKLVDIVFNRQDSIAHIWNTLRRVIGDYEIVYLPTYRRIELALTEEEGVSPYRRRRGPKFNVAAGSLYTGDIQFGLGDIADRLVALNNQIIYASNNGYRELSANIINELIDGSFESEAVIPEDIPTKDELEIFFSRLKEGRRTAHIPSVTAPDLEKLFSNDEVPSTSKKFLDYFLKQLGAVISATKEVEAPVDAFISSCNKYLLSREPSTERLAQEDSNNQPRDGKILRITRRNLRVHVESVPDGRKIPLNALSSGEKQMISLFAKLFLYPKKKIVLIDEPELSLSIDWQSQILVDILNAPLCEQVVAITHSPFVFDNELDPFAQPLSISKSDAVPEEPEVLYFEDGEDFDGE